MTLDVIVIFNQSFFCSNECFMMHQWPPRHLQISLAHRVKLNSARFWLGPMASFEVREPEVRAQAEPPKKSVINKMRRASMAAYLAEKSGVDATAPTKSEREREGITRQEAWSNMVLALVGVMVCYLPRIMYKAGWLMTPPLLLIGALVVVRMGDLICQACELAEQGQGAEAGSVKSYEELATAIGVFKVLLVTKNTVMMATLLLGESFLTGAVEGLLPFDISKSLAQLGKVRQILL